MHSPNSTSQNRLTSQLRPSSALRHWLEDLLTVTLIVVFVGALVLAATLYLDHSKSVRGSAHISRDEASTIPAIYKRQDQGHSIDI
ncbi:MAG: hypothetical protein LC645_03660 [Geobacteraceae bacterium]|nr:hypothetical protein [Geobacteraceae bacterium]